MARSRSTATDSRSSVDPGGTLGTLARTAARLCGANDALIFETAGEQLRLVARHGSIRTTRRVGDTVPASQVLYGLAVLKRRSLHVRDLAVAVLTRFRNAEWAALQRTTGVRTLLAVPMLRAGAAVGVIVLRRTRVRPFTRQQVALAKTFADQAATAIENVRLRAELHARDRAVSEARDRETATGEILGVIASSPTDELPVFETIAKSAARLTGGVVASLYEYDGHLVHLCALAPPTWRGADEFRSHFPRPLAPDFAAGHVILGRTALHVADLLTDPATPPTSRQWAERLGVRSVLLVPMLRDGQPIGVIGVVRAEPGRFSNEQVRLLQTFADQAVIAIENVRLFSELQQKNRALTRARARWAASP